MPHNTEKSAFRRGEYVIYGTYNARYRARRISRNCWEAVNTVTGHTHTARRLRDLAEWADQS